jgi:hypothetical protein
MTFRKKTAQGIGIALSLTLLSACAEARPIGDVRSSGPLTSAAGGYELQVLVDGVPAPTFFQNGETYVMGALGERYTLRILNHTGRRIEAVASVDGRDVVDGRPADFRNKRGYIVPAWGSVDIDGWRLSRAQVAAFRFSSVADSYAARTGTAREVGVIGAAIFPERFVPPPRPIEPYSWNPYNRYRNYDRTRGYPADEAESYGGRSEAPSSKSSADASGPAPSAPPAPAEKAPPPSPAPLSGGGSSSAPRGYADAAPSRRSGLGTEFGEAVGSSVREVSFVRANSSSPMFVLGARYNDHDGLVALGINVDRDPYACGNGGWGCDNDLELRQTANPFPVTDRRYAAPPPCWNGYNCR